MTRHLFTQADTSTHCRCKPRTVEKPDDDTRRCSVCGKVWYRLLDEHGRGVTIP